MNVSIELCDLCHSPLKLNFKYGISIRCVQSKGGWGRAETVPNWEGVVCPKCYEEYKKFADVANYGTKKRKGIRMPDITVTENDVSLVWENQPPSGGCTSGLLP